MSIRENIRLIARAPLKELLESLIRVINLKRLLNVIKEWDATWISCKSLHARLRTQSRLIAVVSSLIARRWVRPQI